MLDLVRARGCSAIVAWAPDRLHRSPRELEDFIDLLDRYGVAVATVQSGHWDLTTPGGRHGGTASRIGGPLRIRNQAGAGPRGDETARRPRQAARPLPLRLGPPRHPRRRSARTPAGRRRNQPAHPRQGQPAVHRRRPDRPGRTHPPRRRNPAESRTGREGEPAPGTCTWGPMEVRTLALRARNAGLLVRRTARSSATAATSSRSSTSTPSTRSRPCCPTRPGKPRPAPSPATC